MNIRRTSAVLFCAVLSLPLLGRAEAAPAEIKGAAILDHPCGKVAVKQMGLAHAGKMDEAVAKLGSKKMQDEWKSMSADDRSTLAGMMKDLSVSEAEFKSEIKSGGLLVIDGNSGTMTIKKERKDANGSSTSTITQRYEIDGAKCLVTR